MMVAFPGTGPFSLSLGRAAVWDVIQQSDSIFTVITTDPAELIQDGFFGCFIRLFVPGTDDVEILPSGRSTRLTTGIFPHPEGIHSDNHVPSIFRLHRL